MKPRVLSALTEGLLAALLVFSALGCLVTGFDLNVSGLTLLFLTLLWTAAFTACWSLPYGWLGSLGLLLLYGVYFVTAGKWDTVTAFLQVIGSRYYTAYGIDFGGLFSHVPSYIFREDLTAAITAILVPMSALVSLSLCRRWPVSLSLPFILLPLVLTLITIDTVASIGFVALLLLGLGLLILTQGVRHRDPMEGAKLTGMLVIPLVLAVSILLNAVPQQGYTPPDVVDKFLAWLTDNPAFTLPTIGIGGTNTGGPPTPNARVDLGQIGPNRTPVTKVMEVFYEEQAVVYLRGKSFSDYEGTAWTNTNAPKKDSFSLAWSYREKDSRFEDVTYRLDIYSVHESDDLYLPYYPHEAYSLAGGAVPNDRGSDWRFQVVGLDESWRDAAANIELRYLPNYTQSKLMYTDLPNSTQIRAQAHLKAMGIHSGTSLATAAETIAAYVRNSAEYSLATDFMPATEGDFALWFLEQSDTGYCVHFASAATVLLRAAGIPARYVEGYTVSVDEACPGGYRTDVTTKMAHAWTEYYVPKVGWVILEATPSAGIDSPPIPTESTDPTAPTVPSQSTDPTAPTAPTAPTIPSGSASTGSAPTESDTTQAPSTGGETPEPGLSVPSWVWITLASVLGGCALLLLQWLLRIRWRYAWLYRGGANAQALKLWRYARFVGRITKNEPPGELKALAQKAKFSQHTLTAQEIAQFDSWFAQVIGGLKQRNVFLQAVYRLIFALY